MANRYLSDYYRFLSQNYTKTSARGFRNGSIMPKKPNENKEVKNQIKKFKKS